MNLTQEHQCCSSQTDIWVKMILLVTPSTQASLWRPILSFFCFQAAGNNEQLFCHFTELMGTTNNNKKRTKIAGQLKQLNLQEALTELDRIVGYWAAERWWKGTVRTSESCKSHPGGQTLGERKGCEMGGYSHGCRSGGCTVNPPSRSMTRTCA